MKAVTADGSIVTVYPDKTVYVDGRWEYLKVQKHNIIKKLFFLYIFWQARVCRPLLRFGRPFMIFFKNWKIKNHKKLLLATVHRPGIKILCLLLPIPTFLSHKFNSVYSILKAILMQATYLKKKKFCEGGLDTNWLYPDLICILFVSFLKNASLFILF